jgi:hypothetical protein
MPKTYDVNALIEELELDQEDIDELISDFKEFLKRPSQNWSKSWLLVI